MSYWFIEIRTSSRDLETLFLSMNRLQSGDFIKTLPSLVEINLEGNQIGNISNDTFTRLNRLEILNMNTNELKHVKHYFIFV